MEMGGRNGDKAMCKMPPMSHWDLPARRSNAERFEEHWLVQTAAWMQWASLAAAATTCLVSIYTIVVAAE
jgi:hypothetical protein